MAQAKRKIEPLFHLTKRTDIPTWKAWVIRIVAIVAAFLISGVICAILTKGKQFGGYYVEMINGAFGTERRLCFWDSIFYIFCRDRDKYACWSLYDGSNPRALDEIGLW